MAKAKSYTKNVRPDSGVAKYVVETRYKSAGVLNKTFKYFKSLAEARTYAKSGQGDESRLFKISYDFITAYK